MATVTAQILTGAAHPNDGGLLGGYFGWVSLILSENSRPSWSVQIPQQLRGNFKRLPAHNSVLIPTLDHPLDDGLLLLAFFYPGEIDWSDEMRQVRREFFLNHRVEMYELSEECRGRLRAELRQHSEHLPKIIISVFQRESLISEHTKQLQFYKNPVSVCLPVFNRQLSGWSGSAIETGQLCKASELHRKLSEGESLDRED